jgi:hypothetical protein
VGNGKKALPRTGLRIKDNLGNDLPAEDQFLVP